VFHCYYDIHLRSCHFMDIFYMRCSSIYVESRLLAGKSGNLGLILSKARDFSVLPYGQDRLWFPPSTKCQVQLVPVAIFLAIKRSVLEDNHSLSPSAESKIYRRCVSTYSYAFVRCKGQLCRYLGGESRKHSPPKLSMVYLFPL